MYALLLAAMILVGLQPPSAPTRPDDPKARAEYNRRVRGDGPRKTVYEQGKERTFENNPEGAVLCLKLAERSLEKGQYNEFCFLMATNYFALNNKAEASKWVKNFKDSFEQPKERRHENLIYLMELDLANWKDGDLGDIERDMKISGGRLENAFAGKGTQDVQKQIVDKLDKLIKEQEDKKNGSGKGDGQDEQKAQKPGQQPGNPSGPAPDSVVMGGSGKGVVDEKKLREYSQNWGTLPPDRRAAIVQEITRDLPPKYKPMIDEYFRALNRMHPNK